MSKLRLRPAQKNGHIHNGKQNYRCLDYGRQFVADYAFKTVTEETKGFIKKALLERTRCVEFAVFSRSACDVVAGVCSWAKCGFARRLGYKPAKRGARTPYPYIPWLSKST